MTVNLNDSLHVEVKVYCAKNQLKINEFIDQAVRKLLKGKK